jgi:hypothetical protein
MVVGRLLWLKHHQLGVAMFRTLSHAPQVRAMTINNKDGHRRAINKEWLVARQPRKGEPNGQTESSGDGRETHVAGQGNDPRPHDQ